MNVITKLALARIRTKKTRSCVICAAIFLTMVLFMTVVCISSNLLTGYGLMMRLAAGTDYHGYLRASAFTVDAVTLRDEMLKSNDIAEAYISSNLTRYAFRESGVPQSRDTIRALESEAELPHFFSSIIEGTFPMCDSEILVNPLYFPDVKVGDSITLYYDQVLDGYSVTADAVFTVSGLIESTADVQLQVVMRYSDTLEEMYGFGANYAVYFMFSNKMNLAGKYDSLVNETLGDYRQPDLERFGALNQAYLESPVKQSLTAANVFLIVFSVATVFLCSFLLIYNIYSIALVQDMQSFGLMNVIGTTRKQLRRMIVIQSTILYAVMLPFGLTAGYFIGWKLLAPVLFEMSGNGMKYEFNPWIVVFTVMLTFFTLIWSALRPLRGLNSMTPISTVEYSPAADLSENYIRKKNYRRKNSTPTVRRLAGFTISRNRKKTVITAMSMSISVILFVLIATISEYGIAYGYDMLQKTDYIIRAEYDYYRVYPESDYETNDEVYSAQYDIDEGIALDEGYISALENNAMTKKIWRIRSEMITIETPAYTRRFLKNWKSACYEHYWNPIQQQILDGRMEIAVVGIPDEFFPYLYDTELNEIGDGFNDGYVMVQYSPTHTLSYENGKNTYAPYSYFEEGSTLKIGKNEYTVKYGDATRMTYKVCGTVMAGIVDRPIIFLPEHHFMEEFGEGRTFALLLDTKPDCYERMRFELEQLGEFFALSIDAEVHENFEAMREEMYSDRHDVIESYAAIDGRLDYFTEMEQNLRAIETVGYSLAAMIFLIGALNIVNTALSSAAERRREFAMLEAVGMTDRQMMRMILTESLYSGGAAVLITVCIGFPLISVIINTAMDALVSLHWQSGMIMLTVCIAVSVLSGLAVFRLSKSTSAAERIQPD
ncbi:MAG: ABC transporter permease [Clostridia bacterium]|nr:ABC transporter permease [Clostridia bacterium]